MGEEARTRRPAKRRVLLVTFWKKRKKQGLCFERKTGRTTKRGQGGGGMTRKKVRIPTSYRINKEKRIKEKKC